MVKERWLLRVAILAMLAPPVSAHPATPAASPMAGAPQSWRAEVIRDASLKGASPQAWAERAVQLVVAALTDPVPSVSS